MSSLLAAAHVARSATAVATWRLSVARGYGAHRVPPLALSPRTAAATRAAVDANVLRSASLNAVHPTSPQWQRAAVSSAATRPVSTTPSPPAASPSSAEAAAANAGARRGDSSAASFATPKTTTETTTGHADAADKLHMYHYTVCPYSSKCRAFLQYYGVPFRTTEVNPLSKAELNFSPHYKKVPIAIMPGSGEQVNGSDEIMDAVRERLLRGGGANAAASGDGRGTSATPTAPSSSSSSSPPPPLLPLPTEHELQWRTWADERLSKTLPPNIYRTLPEAFEAFRYISDSPHFSTAQRAWLRITGSVFMRAMVPRMRRKHGIEAGGERDALYARVREFMRDAVHARDASAADGAAFSGGAQPDMADLSVFGMLRAMHGMRTLRDVFNQVPDAVRWYDQMYALVESSAGRTAQQ